MPAWRAVVDRASLLARRGLEGDVYGALGPPVADAPAELRWLIDETEGDGALAIRVALPAAAAALSAGARVQVRGAWTVDAAGRWVWRGARVWRLPGAAPPPAVPPGLAPVDEAPPGAPVPPSAARRRGDVVAFWVIAPPAKPGDGWLVADTPDGEPVAFAVLPGERGAYGGQDMLAPDEQWPLEVGGHYAIVLARRPRRSGALRLLDSSRPPYRLPGRR